MDCERPAGPIGSDDLHAQRSRDVSAAGRLPCDALDPALPNGDASAAKVVTDDT